MIGLCVGVVDPHQLGNELDVERSEGICTWLYLYAVLGFDSVGADAVYTKWRT